MVENNSSPEKGMFTAVVSSNKALEGRHVEDHFYKLKLIFSDEAAIAFADFRPGQFVELDLSALPVPSAKQIPQELLDSSGRDVLLRRPFSFIDVSEHGDKIHAELLYCVLGPATLRMTQLSHGDSISVIGPLGNGFRIQRNKKVALLVIGGMGVPPIQHLAKVLTQECPQIEAVVFAGARTKKELPFQSKLDALSQQVGFALPEFAALGMESYIATDDGTAGHQGYVTDCLDQWFERNNPAAGDVIIYSCGPEAMLAQVAKTARKKNIDCQVSMERSMACGIGLCQSCAVECRKTDSQGTFYKMCCQDGPVFDTKEVVFAS